MAEVTFQAASEWVFGRSFDGSDRGFTLEVFLQPMVPPQALGTTTSLELLFQMPQRTQLNSICRITEYFVLEEDFKNYLIAWTRIYCMLYINCQHVALCVWVFRFFLLLNKILKPLPVEKNKQLLKGYVWKKKPLKTQIQA